MSLFQNWIVKLPTFAIYIFYTYVKNNIISDYVADDFNVTLIQIVEILQQFYIIYYHFRSNWLKISQPCGINMK